MYSERLVGEKISELRNKKGLSRAQLAAMMPVSVQAVGKWERGESLPDIIVLKKLADILDADLNMFFENSNNADSSASDDRPLKSATADDWNLSAANWKNADFSGLTNLADKFKRSNVISCKFKRSDLSGIAFKGNNIKNCDFTSADLSKSSLFMCNIPDNNFGGCNFQSSGLKMCDIHGSDFSDCDFTDAEINGTVFKKNNLKGIIWHKTSFINTVFTDTVIESDITDCTFTGCAFKNTQFKNITLNNNFFKNSKFKKIEWINCKTDKITYSFLKNSKADLDGLVVIEE